MRIVDFKGENFFSRYDGEIADIKVFWRFRHVGSLCCSEFSFFFFVRGCVIALADGGC